MQCKYELNVKNINKREKKSMLESLIKSDMYFECKELCYVFINNLYIESEKRILYDIVKQCSMDRNKSIILQMIKEW